MKGALAMEGMATPGLEGKVAGAALGAPGDDVREVVEVGELRVGAGLVEAVIVIQRSLVPVQLSRVVLPQNAEQPERGRM